ncbi:MAG: phosphomannomutase CpsG [Endozoicomonas sp.]
MKELSCFKAYDIRGRLGDELNEDIVHRIGRAYGEYLKPGKVVLGGDVRDSSESLKRALAEGLIASGVDVIDLGMTGTEEIYFATFHLGVDGGIQVTASHNPADYNGMKLVREDAKPISGDTGLHTIKRLAEEAEFVDSEHIGSISTMSTLDAYIDHILGYIDLDVIKPLKLVVNAGNGAAGHVVDAIESRFSQAGVPVSFIKVHHEPDGSFPNGIPNPLLSENRSATAEAVRKHDADMGIAWDGDFDRCFFFDEQGQFIEGYYIVGLLAQTYLANHPGSKIIHDPRLTWNTVEQVMEAGGIPVQSKTGHAFIKERMRLEGALYGGEMSAHHYFRDFNYCDSGMIPWLLVIELVSRKNRPLSMLVEERIAKYPSSGEINRKVEDPDSVIQSVRKCYEHQARNIDYTDGLSIEMDEWRMNIRVSNTEPVLRLNVESRGNRVLMEEKTAEILQIITGKHEAVAADFEQTDVSDQNES